MKRRRSTAREYGGQVYNDKLIRVFVDVPDTPENRAFFLSFKERLKSRFKQLDIWMTTELRRTRPPQTCPRWFRLLTFNSCRETIGNITTARV
jgi:hypothetical protein